MTKAKTIEQMQARLDKMSDALLRMTNENKAELAERVMVGFNLSSETYESLPRGLASELGALLAERDQLRVALKDLMTIARTFRMVPNEEHHWGALDDEVYEQAEAALNGKNSEIC